MNWEKVGKASYQFSLSVIEWGFKLCALVAGMLALAANGSFGNKVGTAFGSLPEGLRQLFTFPSAFNKMSWTAREYHQMGEGRFREAYGMMPVDQLIGSLSGYFSFFHEISVSLSRAPLMSVTAALMAFLSFYVLGRIIRFARQRGQGSYLCRLEQQLGDQVFNRRERLKEKVREFTQRKTAQKKLEKSSPKTSDIGI